MKRALKTKTLIIALVTLFLCVFAVMFQISNKVNAENYGSVTMDAGAYLKLQDKNGLRMRVQLDETAYNNLIGNENVKLFFEIKKGETAVWQEADKEKIYTDGNGYYYSNCLLEFNADSLNRKTDYRVLAYIQGGENEPQYATFTSESQITKNLYTVANKALLSSDLDEDSVISLKTNYSFVGNEDYPFMVSTTEEYNVLIDRVNNGMLTSAKVIIGEDVDMTQSALADGKTLGTVIVKVNNANKNKLKDDSIQSKYVQLTEDLDFSGENWNSPIDFYGVLDGNGYSINNFTAKTNGGLFKELGTASEVTVIKNVKFNNAECGGDGGAGILAKAVNPAKGTQNTVRIENVVIKVTKVKNAYSPSALIANLNGNGYISLMLKDVLVYACDVDDTGVTTGTFGLLAGWAKGVGVTASNVITISATSEQRGNNVNNSSTCDLDGLPKFKTVAKARAYVDNVENNASEFLKEQVSELYNAYYTEVRTYQDIQKLAGTENVLMMNDIDFSGSAGWESNITFNGTFDGNGYSIKNLQPKAGGNGLFKTFNGIIQNVSFVGVKLREQTAVVGYNVTAKATVRNVFVKVSSITLGYNDRLYQTGCLFGKVDQITLNLDSVIVDIDVELPPVLDGADSNKNEFGYVGGWCKFSTLNMKSCYFIGGYSRVYGYMLDNSTEYKPKNDITNTYNLYGTRNDFDSAVSDGTITLSAELAALIA